MPLLAGLFRSENYAGDGANALYRTLRCDVPEIRIRVAELFADALPASDDRRAIADVLADAHRIVAGGHPERSPEHSQLEASVQRLWALDALAEKAVEHGTGRLSQIGLLLSSTGTPTVPLYQLAAAIGEQRIVITICQTAFGITDPRAVGLIQSYVADRYTTRRAEWFATQLRNYPGRPGLVPVLIDLADSPASRAKDNRLEIRRVISEIAAAELTPAQEEVLFTLAYDGGIAPADLVAVACHLA